jgi:limonene-1,2-epoxide hydrolase
MTPIEIVDTFIAAIEAKDIDAAVALTADDISYENMPIDPVVGHDELAKTLHGYLDPAGEVDWRIVEQWAVDRTVINERVDRFQIGDGWLELPVAGIFKIDDDGKITLWRDYFDLAGYMRQLTELTGT